MGFGGRGRGRGRGGPRGGFMGRGGGGRGGFGGDRGPSHWGGPGGGSDFGGQHEDYVSVPASKCGLVIGKGGETIKNINQVKKLKITFAVHKKIQRLFIDCCSSTTKCKRRHSFESSNKKLEAFLRLCQLHLLTNALSK